MGMYAITTPASWDVKNRGYLEHCSPPNFLFLRISTLNNYTAHRLCEFKVYYRNTCQQTSLTSSLTSEDSRNGWESPGIQLSSSQLEGLIFLFISVLAFLLFENSCDFSNVPRRPWNWQGHLKLTEFSSAETHAFGMETTCHLFHGRIHD